MYKPTKLEPINDQFGEWDLKYYRENPFMGFGTIMKSYAEINQGKEVESESMVRIANRFWDWACQITNKRLTDSKDINKIHRDLFDKEYNQAESDTADDYNPETDKF